MNYDFMEQVIAFAEKAHEGQKRKYTGEPYVNHCKEVAELVKGFTTNQDTIAAAYLHDTLEDTPTSLQTLVWCFGPRVALLVYELTDVFTKEAFPNLNRAQRKVMENYRLGRITNHAKLVKFCDIQNNSETIEAFDPDFTKVYLPEKEEALRMMFGTDNIESIVRQLRASICP